ncbi:MAG: hypothetical protein WCC64_14910 [Aliidongia sp.]
MEQKANIRESDPSSWPANYDIEENVTDPSVLECFTDRLVSGIEELLGPGRWCGERRWGFWPVNFSFGADQPYEFPNWGWHVDGNWFRHTIDCPKQGLLVIGLFTDIAPRQGGTILALGSHKRTARILARHPHGLSHLELFKEVLAERLGNFHEVTGAAGDVILAHPFLFHTRGMKHGGPPRIISNTEAPLRAATKFLRPNPDDYSVLEKSIRNALLRPAEPPENARMCRF